MWKKCIFDTNKIGMLTAYKIVQTMELGQITLYDSDCFLAAKLLECRYNLLLTSAEKTRAKNHVTNVWKTFNKNNNVILTIERHLNNTLNDEKDELEKILELISNNNSIIATAQKFKT